LLDAGAVHAPQERADLVRPRLLRRSQGLREVARADPQHPPGPLYADLEHAPQRRPARLVARYRPALGRDLPLPAIPACARRSAAGGAVLGDQPGSTFPARRADRISAPRDRTALWRQAARIAARRLADRAVRTPWPE